MEYYHKKLLGIEIPIGIKHSRELIWENIIMNDNWIKIGDRLPKKGEYVLISWDGIQFQQDAYYDHQQKKWQDIKKVAYDEEEICDPIRPITHWMILPTPPIKEETNET